MENYKTFALEMAKDAGEIMKKNFTLGMNKQWKKDKTPVTESDLLINTMLIERVHKSFPDHGVLAEEKSDMKDSNEYVWVCDPIDGTIPFSHGLPISTFSLALVKNGESILGVVYNPFQDQLFVGEKGKGATLNGNTVHVSQLDSLTEVAGEYEMFQRAKYDLSALVDHFSSEYNMKLFRLCSFVYPSMLVAAGELTFTIFPHTTAHDAAAVKIIVEEAGGIVRDIYGNEQRYDRPINGLLVSNKAFYEKLLTFSKKHVVLK